jgi:DNA polymerase-3 subunit chi
MTEVFFYHLQRMPLERVLPTLLEKSLERRWHAVVQVTGEERAAAIDDLLWTYDDQSFLPHGRADEEAAAGDAVVITLDFTNPNEAAIRFLVDGAALPPDPGRYQRIMIIFDGNDDDALAHARTQWKEAKAAGLETTYWQQDENGRWSRKA